MRRNTAPRPPIADTYLASGASMFGHLHLDLDLSKRNQKKANEGSVAATHAGRRNLCQRWTAPPPPHPHLQQHDLSSFSAPAAPAELRRRRRRAPALPRRVRRQRQQRYPAYLLLCGVAVQQCGWWSFYGDLGLWCGLVGGAAALAGAVGFDCAPGHSRDWRDRPYTADERREINQARRNSGWEDLPADAKKTLSGGRGWFWTCLFLSFASLFCLPFVLGVMCKELGRMR